jgi:cytochrome c5
MGVKVGVAGLVLAAAVGVCATEGGMPVPAEQAQKTTRDRIYTKEQATRGAEVYLKFCERCHDPAKVLPGKKPGPPVTGDEFFKVWQDRSLAELFDVILNTMPSDGSAFLDESQALDVVTRILQMNGLPDGQVPLASGDPLKAIVIVK